MENQTMYFSSSSKRNSEELQSVIAAMGEESAEKTVKNDNIRLSSPQEVISENKPSFEFNFAHRGKEIMKVYPSKSNKIYTCNLCKKVFSTSQALGGHQNAHKQERQWDKKRKEMEADYPGLSLFNPYLDKPHILLGGYSQDALSNENHLGITLDPRKRVVHPGKAFGGINNMNMAIAPCKAFTGYTSANGYASRGLNLLPSYNPLIPNKFLTPPQTTNVSRDLSLQENVLSEKNLISKIGMQNVVEIDDDDDDDQPEEEKSKGKYMIDLSLSL